MKIKLKNIAKIIEANINMNGISIIAGNNKHYVTQLSHKVLGRKIPSQLRFSA